MPSAARRLFCSAAQRASHPRRTRWSWSEPESLIIGSGSGVASHRFHNWAALSTQSKYQWIDGAEHLPNYSPGGYHPIEIGSVLHDRYRVIDKLGYGGWSTVWLVHDVQQTRYLALKVGIAESLPREMPMLRALGASEDAPGSDAVPHLVDELTVEGPNGTHRCYASLPRDRPRPGEPQETRRLAACSE
ncbi:protein kinase domain-containing protein [Beauveria brongniartii RCEF 3172]|uniref:non-specific serine/threonine protein kinase n=1 Tax=Beauveria brongniartii RCEF 3172 TaxID=1081107 RepID=A0A166RV06_9HYPO|nr:protein kinase domain-containing protein [Beauveria brongniartii RCEF 3172]